MGTLALHMLCSGWHTSVVSLMEEMVALWLTKERSIRSGAAELEVHRNTLKAAMEQYRGGRSFLVQRAHARNFERVNVYQEYSIDILLVYNVGEPMETIKGAKPKLKGEIAGMDGPNLPEHAWHEHKIFTQ